MKINNFYGISNKGQSKTGCPLFFWESDILSVFIGSGVALVTPFTKDGKINFNKLKELIDYQIENETDAIIICGTTGEGSTINYDEKIECFEKAVKYASGRVPIIAGTGSNSTAYSQMMIREAEKTGIDAHLIVTPYYNKTSQRGIIEHYYTLADTAEKPVIVYNVPSRTGVNILPETYSELSKHPNIAGVKEAGGNLTQMMNTIKLCGDKLDIYVGNDDQTASSTAMGAKGVISVLANICPKETHDMALSGVIGDTEKSHIIQMRYLKLISLLFSDVNPIPVKAAMNYLGFDVGPLRLPLVEINSENAKKLFEEIDRLKIKYR